MKREPVSSSNIKSVGYDEMTSTLEIEFGNGDVWQYRGVPKAIYQEMMEAASIGKYFYKNIKSQFDAERQ